MCVHRVLRLILAASAILLVASMGPQNDGAALETAPGATIPYTGQLSQEAGPPVPDGKYDFRFSLFAVESGGDPAWSEVQEEVPVQAGAFTTSLGRSTPIPAALLDSPELWLAVAVRGPDDIAYVALEPRQRLSAIAPAVAASPQAGAACPHDHVGEEWVANIPWSSGAFKVYNYGNGPSIWGWNGGNGNGLRGYATGTGLGVYGESEGSGGVVGRSTNGRGMEGYSTNGYGILAHSDNNHSLYVDGAGSNGVHVASSGDHGVYVASAGWDGVAVWSAAVAGMWVNSAGQDGVLVSTAGWDGVHVVGPVGGVYYGSGKRGDEDFAVLNTGEVRSKVGFAAPANDFAVTMEVEGERSSYEPGDVLVVSSSGAATAERAMAAYSPSVIGVYAAAPAFVGGRTVTGEAAEQGAPIAILGIAACKVSAENGPIRPGDLLVTAATPGHAMRADDPRPGTILGKALEPLDNGTGVIQVLLTLR